MQLSYCLPTFNKYNVRIMEKFSYPWEPLSLFHNGSQDFHLLHQNEENEQK